MERSLRILIAEDNPLNRELAVFSMKRLGHEARAVCNGREALEILAREPFDVVLMDCQMPDIDGFEATRRLRQRGDLVPVIACTALQDATVRDRCRSAGMNDFLAKPFGLADVSAVFRRCLS